LQNQPLLRKTIPPVTLGTKREQTRIADLKRILKLSLLRLRGPSGAHNEFFWLQWRNTFGKWQKAAPQ
jgi:hypothetical protein